MEYLPLFTASYLRSIWAGEFGEYVASGRDEEVQESLRKWGEKDFQKETTAQGTFVDVFFKRLWGYRASGETEAGEGFSCHAEYPVARAGQTGGTGSADLALGWFGQDRYPTTPQVFCEFKDVRSGLDIPQNRKGNTRSPVKQCADYLRYASAELYGNEPVQPSWAIVTDMNEFRLYSERSIPHRFQRFVIRVDDRSDAEDGLLGDGEAVRFRRFVFSKMFRPEMLLGTTGSSKLEEHLGGQWIHEKEIESEFYKRYQEYRQFVYESLLKANPAYAGRQGRLVRLTQRFLDRCIFVLFCEDMGSALDFPRNIARDLLIELSQFSYIHGDDDVAWQQMKSLFGAMRDGGRFGHFHLNRFNGGLFAPDRELEDLHIPTKVFLEPGQGMTAEGIEAHPRTLLYLSAMYNFGATGPGDERAIDLYALGRIFEQSITDLEVMEAHAEGRVSLMEISRRKRDGVYYTPEWVIHYIVEETVGARLQELREETGVEKLGPVTDEEALDYFTNRNHSRSDHKRIRDYIGALDAYRERLDELTVVDPACGSGAFLIGSLQRLIAERRWLIEERSRVSHQTEIFDQDAVTRSILSRNIYGVDINGESIEITRLALWLHTATPGQPLCSLDENIQCGNSLVGSDFYEHHQAALFDEDEKERINTFDWERAFPEVFERGGFDCVVGNPPYVKLQHFRKVQAPVAEYLRAALGADGRPLYRSTQTGNFDLYLPFIERGIGLLNSNGRLGYIAPSVWLKNDYGRGLRELVHEQGSLERWLDFKSFQVFEEATTYTALQFFRARPQPGVQLVESPDGDLKGVGWDGEEVIPYEALVPEEPWNLQPPAAFRLINRLQEEFPSLEEMTERIFQGLITSADAVYHLTRVEPGVYISHAERGNPVEVHIEDGLMRPLVSGPEAKRYQQAKTEIYLLFPYDLSGEKPRLWSAEEMEERFPAGWAYLREHEERLRGRERGKFDIDGWYQFGRRQNIDKQEFAKLIVARLGQKLEIFADEQGEFFLDNVDVNGILAAEEDLFYLLACLNSPLSTYIWQRISKPFRGGYYAANKQFIAPLPIPDGAREVRARLGAMAKELQEKHSLQRDLIEELSGIFESPQVVEKKHSEDWIWGDYRGWRAWRPEAPEGLTTRERNAWAKNQAEADLQERLLPVEERLRPGAVIGARADGRALSVLVDGVAVLEHIYVGAEEAEFIAAQWRHLGRTTNVTARYDSRRLLRDLLRIRQTKNQHLVDAVLEKDGELEELGRAIFVLEEELNEEVYGLYGLSAEERRLVEGDFGASQ